jgi:hypothetical protein
MQEAGGRLTPHFLGAIQPVITSLNPFQGAAMRSVPLGADARSKKQFAALARDTGLPFIALAGSP